MQLNKNCRVLTTDTTLYIKCSYRELVCVNFFLVVVFYSPGLKTIQNWFIQIRFVGLEIVYSKRRSILLPSRYGCYLTVNTSFDFCYCFRNSQFPSFCFVIISHPWWALCLPFGERHALIAVGEAQYNESAGFSYAKQIIAQQCNWVKGESLAVCNRNVGLRSNLNVCVAAFN